MNSLFKKALRDLIGEGGRSASVIVALALGIAGFLAVLSAYPILTRSLNEGYRATNPASATIFVDRLDDEAVRAVSLMDGLSGAEARRTVRGRIRTGSGQWANLVLFARRDFESSRIGMVFPERGAWPPASGDIAIERDAMRVAGVELGERVTVRVEAGPERELLVAGTVHDVGQAQARMENLVYGYATIETLESLGIAPFYDELAIKVAQDELDKGRIRAAAEKAARMLEERGYRVDRIDVPEPGQHPHAKLMGLLTLSIAVFGLFILALSGVIIFNVLSALLAGQRRQIGIMKALGGSRSRIARLYIVEAGLLGLAALAAAMPVGLAAGRWLCRAMGVFLNFDIVSYDLPWWIYALALGAALAVPIASALIPVWLGTRVSVRETLDPVGRSGRTFGSSAFDRALARARGGDRIVSMAIRNLGRGRLRVALTLVTLVAGGVFFMSALDLRLAIAETFDGAYRRSPIDLSIALAAEYPIEAVDRAARSAAGVSTAEAWVAVKAVLRKSEPREGDQEEVAVWGLPSGSSLAALDISVGQDLAEDHGEAVVNTSLYQKLGKPPIHSALLLAIDGRDIAFRIRGVAREPTAPAAAYVLRSSLDGPTKAGKANTVRISLANKDPTSAQSAKAIVETSLALQGLRVVAATTKEESRLVVSEHLLMIDVFLLVVSTILGGVGTLGLATTVSLNMSERRREMGVLRAIGASPSRIAAIVVIEGVAIGALSWVMAAALAGPLSKTIGESMLRFLLRIDSEIPVAIDPWGILIWLAVALLASAVASLIPALRASRSSIREALTYE